MGEHKTLAQVSAVSRNAGAFCQCVMYRIFSNLLYRSPAFLWHSCLFPTISVCSITIPIRSVSLRCLWFVPLSIPSMFFRLIPSTSLFRLVSFQFSILGSDRSEFRSLLLSVYISVQPQSCFRWSPCQCFIVFWSYDLCFPFRIMIRFLLFCSVYKFGKLCSYSLACNRTKPPVS